MIWLIIVPLCLFAGFVVPHIFNKSPTTKNPLYYNDFIKMNKEEQKIALSKNHTKAINYLAINYMSDEEYVVAMNWLGK